MLYEEGWEGGPEVVRAFTSAFVALDGWTGPLVSNHSARVVYLYEDDEEEESREGGWWWSVQSRMRYRADVRGLDWEPPVAFGCAEFVLVSVSVLQLRSAIKAPTPPKIVLTALMHPHTQSNDIPHAKTLYNHLPKYVLSLIASPTPS